MADKPTYYTQFDGDEIDGKLYGLGDPLDDAVNVGTIHYLSAIGRIATTKPTTHIVVPAGNMPLADMDRSQLEATARAELDLADYSDDQLRDGIEKRRAAKLDAPADDSKDETSVLDGTVNDVKAALDQMTVEQLEALRAEEVAGKNRTGAIAAIDEEIAAKKAAPPAE